MAETGTGGQVRQPSPRRSSRGRHLGRATPRGILRQLVERGRRAHGLQDPEPGQVDHALNLAISLVPASRPCSAPTIPVRGTSMPRWLTVRHRHGSPAARASAVARRSRSWRNRNGAWLARCQTAWCGRRPQPSISLAFKASWTRGIEPPRRKTSTTAYVSFRPAPSGREHPIRRTGKVQAPHRIRPVLRRSHCRAPGLLAQPAAGTSSRLDPACSAALRRESRAARSLPAASSATGWRAS